jgi:oxygen-independent coproporphyrinogen-3 oxidase
MAIKHLYVHTPFCRSRCAYCDFASEAIGPHARAGRTDDYLAHLRAELDVFAPLLEAPAETIYLGGGTPTELPRHELLALVRDLAALQTRCSPVRASAALAAPEFTVEANPGTVDTALLEELAVAGVTRLSLGVQSFSSRLRQILGRRVSQEDLEGCLSAIRAAGWSEWNIDLIHGIPGQTWEEASADLDRAIEARPSHVSLYDLTYTPSYSESVEASLGAAAVEAAQDFAEANYAGASARLVEAGYARYEVSNFARPGHECRHNLAYWRGEDYLGIGAGAVSTTGNERRANPRSVADYLARTPPEIEILDARTRTWEKAMLGLRTSEGVDEREVRSVLDPEAEKRLLRQGCLEKGCGKLRLNPGFLDLSNSVISALLVSPDGQ